MLKPSQSACIVRLSRGADPFERAEALLFLSPTERANERRSESCAPDRVHSPDRAHNIVCSIVLSSSAPILGSPRTGKVHHQARNIRHDTAASERVEMAYFLDLPTEVLEMVLKYVLGILERIGKNKGFEGQAIRAKYTLRRIHPRVRAILDIWYFTDMSYTMSAERPLHISQRGNKEALLASNAAVAAIVKNLSLELSHTGFLKPRLRDLLNSVNASIESITFNCKDQHIPIYRELFEQNLPKLWAITLSDAAVAMCLPEILAHAPLLWWVRLSGHIKCKTPSSTMISAIGRRVYKTRLRGSENAPLGKLDVDNAEMGWQRGVLAAVKPFALECSIIWGSHSITELSNSEEQDNVVQALKHLGSTKKGCKLSLRVMTGYYWRDTPVEQKQLLQRLTKEWQDEGVRVSGLTDSSTMLEGTAALDTVQSPSQ